jgi:hypothetical protein
MYAVFEYTLEDSRRLEVKFIELIISLVFYIVRFALLFICFPTNLEKYAPFPWQRAASPE